MKKRGYFAFGLCIFVSYDASGRGIYPGDISSVLSLNVTEEEKQSTRSLLKRYGPFKHGKYDERVAYIILEMPIKGKLIQKGNKKNKAIVFETPFAEEVHAPVAGRVTYVGKLRDKVVATSAPGRVAYGEKSGDEEGLSLIIDHGTGYHIILSGIEKTRVFVGQVVAPGDNVGEMRGHGTQRPKLIFELQDEKGPLSPLPGLERGGGLKE